MQSLLLIVSQLVLLYICLYFQPQYTRVSQAERVAVGDVGDGDEEAAGGEQPDSDVAAPHRARRPLNFWQWERLGSYLEFLAGLIVVLGILHAIIGRFRWCVHRWPWLEGHLPGDGQILRDGHN